MSNKNIRGKRREANIYEEAGTTVSNAINLIDSETEIFDTEEVEEKQIVVKGVVSNCSKLNVRRSPSIDSEVVCVIDKGSEVTISDFSNDGDWYNVTLPNGKTGYSMQKYVSINN